MSCPLYRQKSMSWPCTYPCVHLHKSMSWPCTYPCVHLHKSLSWPCTYPCVHQHKSMSWPCTYPCASAQVNVMTLYLPVCILTCCCRWLSCLKVLSQKEHLCLRTLLCTNMCWPSWELFYQIKKLKMLALVITSYIFIFLGGIKVSELGRRLGGCEQKKYQEKTSYWHSLQIYLCNGVQIFKI